MKKFIKKYGNCLVITFTSDEQKIYELKEGVILDFEIKKEGGENEKSINNHKNIERER